MDEDPNQSTNRDTQNAGAEGVGTDRTLQDNNANAAAQPGQPEGAAVQSQKKKGPKVSTLERRRKKHAGKIADFSLQENSQMRGGFSAEADRKVTDCAFAAIFYLLLAGVIGIAIYGFVDGDFGRLMAPMDSDGRLCGIGENADYPRLYYYELAGNNTNRTGTCVKKCPESKDFQFIKDDCRPTKAVITCAIGPNKGYATENLLNYCVKSEKASKVTSDKSRSFFKDLELAYAAIFICLALGFVYTLLYMYALSLFATQLTYLCIGLLELLLLAGVVGCIYGAAQVDEPAGAWIGAAVFFVVFLIFNCMLYLNWSQLRVAIAIIDATADFVVATKRLALVTVIYFFVGLLLIILWAFGVVGVFALNDVKTVKNNQGVYVRELIWSSKSEAMAYIMLFGVIWITAFIRDQNVFINMISAAQYYFTSSREKEGAASVIGGVRTAHFKHAGSIALGSFIHALVFFIKLIVESIQAAASRDGESNPLLCCLHACVGCFESCVEYLNKAAYAFMAISGDPYCKSAWNGFILTLKHMVKLAFCETLSSLLVFLGVLAIALLNVLTCLLIITYGTKSSADVDTLWAPLIIIFFTSLLTAELFLGLFGESVTATLMCLAVDLELSGEAQYGPPTFHEKLDQIRRDRGDASQAEIELEAAQPAPKSQQVQ